VLTLRIERYTALRVRLWIIIHNFQLSVYLVKRDLLTTRLTSYYLTDADITATNTNTTATSSKYPSGQLAPGGTSDLFDEVISVTATIANIGSLEDAEVAQLYISYPDEAAQPPKVLRGFEKATIASGESATVTFSVRRHNISYWNVAAQDWAIVSGDYTFSVGSSSRDVLGEAKLTI
jgi:beta-glucosidase